MGRVVPHGFGLLRFSLWKQAELRPGIRVVNALPRPVAAGLMITANATLAMNVLLQVKAAWLWKVNTLHGNS